MAKVLLKVNAASSPPRQSASPRKAGNKAKSPSPSSPIPSSRTGADSRHSQSTAVKTPSKLRTSQSAATVEASDLADLAPSPSPKSFTTPTSRPGSVKRKAAFETPTPRKVSRLANGHGSARPRNDADRSARRKVTRDVLERSLANGDHSEDEELHDSGLLGNILHGEAAVIDPELDDSAAKTPTSRKQRPAKNLQPTVEQEASPAKAGESNAETTPIKRGRGRPKGAKNKRTPTPPRSLAAHERFFYQNRATALKVSSSSNELPPAVASLDLASYKEAIATQDQADRHLSAVENLHAHHSSYFPRWAFELSQGFNLILHGYGSKRRLLAAFAHYLDGTGLIDGQAPTIILVDGHHAAMSMRSLIITIGRTLEPTFSTAGLPAAPLALMNSLFSHMEEHPPQRPIYLLVDPVHARPLTAANATELFARLAAHPAIRLVGAAENPNFPLLYTAPQRDAFNFVFHDATTFLPLDHAEYPADTSETSSQEETAGDLAPAWAAPTTNPVDAVLELLGRKTASQALDREGVRWVLRSLPENARGVYRVLISELLALDDNGALPAIPDESTRGKQAIRPGRRGRAGDADSDDSDDSDGDNPFAATTLPRSKAKGTATAPIRGVEAKQIYRLASEEFLCSSEMSFWTLLREFVDHHMVVIRRDRAAAALSGSDGTGELLDVETSRADLEGVLEDLVE